jgi:hypothetical protein
MGQTLSSYENELAIGNDASRSRTWLIVDNSHLTDDFAGATMSQDKVAAIA